MRAVALVCVFACGSSQPPAEVAPLPDEPAPAPPTSTSQDRLVELIEELAAAVRDAGPECAAAESALQTFRVRHGPELETLAEHVENKGESQQVRSRLEPAMETILEAALSCPGFDTRGLLEARSETSSGQAFAEIARGGAIVYWPDDVQCQRWKLSGDTEGQLLRMSPAPVLRFSYTVDEDDVVIAGDPDGDDPGPLGEVRAELACRERLPLGTAGSGSVAVGGDRWYLDESECRESERSTAVFCAAKVSQLVAEAEPTPDLLGAVFEKNGWISVVTLEDSAPSCVEWRFTGRAGNKKLERTVDNTRTYFEASYDGTSIRLTDHELGVQPLSRGVYLVGGRPWFIEEDCGGLKMATP